MLAARKEKRRRRWQQQPEQKQIKTRKTGQHFCGHFRFLCSIESTWVNFTFDSCIGKHAVNRRSLDWRTALQACANAFRSIVRLWIGYWHRHFALRLLWKIHRIDPCIVRTNKRCAAYVFGEHKSRNLTCIPHNPNSNPPWLVVFFVLSRAHADIFNDSICYVLAACVAFLPLCHFHCRYFCRLTFSLFRFYFYFFFSLAAFTYVISLPVWRDLLAFCFV